MTETSINYAKALYGLSVPGEAICETGKIFKNTPEIGKMLENPLVSLKEKEQVIERIFPQEMKSFLKVTCKYQKIDRIGEILEAYGCLQPGTERNSQGRASLCNTSCRSAGK